jgi:hypothetical protein
MRPRSFHAAALALALATASTRMSDATACGGFFSSKSGPLPSLSVERVLLIHDDDTGTEHFVREVTFHAASQVFGFLVPTPTRPEVAKVDGGFFPRLEQTFPFNETRGKAAAPAGVDVLSTQKVGSFTAFVLAAGDADALKQWLDQHKLQSTAASKEWLDHYVKRRFFFTAFRYDPPPGKPSGEATTEIQRISFQTAVPFYPYIEPDRDDLEPDRVVALWLASRQASTPVAAQKQADGTYAWKRPFREGEGERTSKSDEIAAIVGASVPLPKGALIVQRFEDQKSKRRGYGDVVFVPKEKITLDPSGIEARKRFLSILDPSLEAP